VAFSLDGARVVSAGGTSVKIWNLQTGELLASLIGERDGEWLTITPRGYFVSSPNGSAALNIVRGLKVYPLGSYANLLRHPEPITQALKPDATSTYQNIAPSLEELLSSQAAP